MRKSFGIVSLALILILALNKNATSLVLLQEANLTQPQTNSLIQSLEKKTGLPISEVNGFLRAEGADSDAGWFWNPLGKLARVLLLLHHKSGSLTARMLLSDSISSPYVYRVRTSRESTLGRVFRGKAIDLNFADLDRLTYRDIPRETFDSGMIFLHELVHLRERLTDPTFEQGKVNPEARGDTVDYVNRIHKELKLPERQHYFPRKTPGKKNVWSIYFGKGVGRVEIEEEILS